jgi:hypothetical protein
MLSSVCLSIQKSFYQKSALIEDSLGKNTKGHSDILITMNVRYSGNGCVPSGALAEILEPVAHRVKSKCITRFLLGARCGICQF